MNKKMLARPHDGGVQRFETLVPTKEGIRVLPLHIKSSSRYSSLVLFCFVKVEPLEGSWSYKFLFFLLGL